MADCGRPVSVGLRALGATGLAAGFFVQLVLFGVPGVGAGVVPAKSDCQRISVSDPQMRWVQYGAWDADGETLSLVDIAHATILRYLADGTALEEVTRPGYGPLDFNHPAELRAAKDGYILLDFQGRGPHFVWLDRDLRPVRALKPQAGANKGHGGLNGKCWEYLNGQFVGYGRRIDSAGQREHGWLAVDAMTDDLVSFRAEELNWEYIGLNRCSVVSNAEKVYLLDLGDPSLIRKVFPGEPSTLTAFPDRFRKPPRLPPRGGAKASVGRLLALTQATAAVELHARGGFLFLLTREPSESGTTWQLHQIDPEVDKIVEVHRLPTTADHVRLVPGPKYWAVLEHGPVVAPGQKELLGWWLISSDLLEDDPTPKKELPLDGNAICS